MTDQPLPQQLQWPLTATTRPDGSRTFQTVDQDSRRDLQGAVALLCQLRPGQLPWAEDVGITDPLGTTDPQDAARLIEIDLRRMEQRPAAINVTVVETDAGGRDLRLQVSS